jgi:hypothetical protein
LGETSSTSSTGTACCSAATSKNMACQHAAAGNSETVRRERGEWIEEEGWEEERLDSAREDGGGGRAPHLGVGLCCSNMKAVSSLGNGLHEQKSERHPLQQQREDGELAARRCPLHRHSMPG